MSDQADALSHLSNVRYNQTAFLLSTHTTKKIAIGFGGGEHYYNRLDPYPDDVESGPIGYKISGAFHPNRAGYEGAYLPAYRQTLLEQVAAHLLHDRAVEEGYDETFLQIEPRINPIFCCISRF